MKPYALSSSSGLTKLINLILLLSVLDLRKLLGETHIRIGVRFLSLLMGSRDPCEEPAWQVLTDLKDIVDVAVCPVHTEESICISGFQDL